MPWPSAGKHLGKPTPRLDGSAKVAGRAKYTTDITPAGTLVGVIFRSKWPAARIHAINLEKARAAPGIRAAIVVQPGEHVVRYYGEELAALAGVSRQAALDALRLIEVDATPLPFTVNELDAIQPDVPRVVPERPNLGAAETQVTGDVDAAFAAAAAVVESAFTTQVEIHHPLEPHGDTVASDGEEYTAWCSTQGVFQTREDLARILAVPQTKVRVICEHMGGGFGSKIENWANRVLCARLAQAAGAPVKLILARSEQALSVGNRPSSFQKLKLAADASGKLTAFEMVMFGTPGHAAGPNDAGGGVIGIPAPYIYPAPNTRVRQSKLAVNAGPATWMRAPGHPVASFGMESILDELAAKLGMDPLEIRLKNDPLPLRRREFQIGAEKFGWKEKYRKPGSSPGPVKVGVGCAGAGWMSGGGGTQAEVQVNPDGTVEVRCGTQDLGTGSRTVVAVVAAEMLGLEPAQIAVRVGDTRLPPSGLSGGSATTASVAPAIYDACEKTLAEVAKASGVEDPRGARWLEACSKIGSNPLVVAGKWREGLSTGGAGGVQFAEVEVDADTGFVKVRKILCVQDCGTVVNKLTCESQLNGGIIMGIGYALYEQRIMDARSGVVLNPNFETYKLTGAADVPEIEIILLDMPERGVIGMGEPATIPTAAAIANAVANALGVRVTSLPITPDKVLAALGRSPKVTPTPSEGLPLDQAFARVAAAPVVPAAPPATARRRGAYA
ncbi:MAG TPA: xanthine dehydrogenase family protein molybdopterin-binding subunit [Opitutaceae bacterium]|nr:xanthine dehydrogenase family protein molybdopterin-binding subunit [Opitutaceae bacterium]